MNAIRKMSFKLLDNEEELMRVKVIAFLRALGKGSRFYYYYRIQAHPNSN